MIASLSLLSGGKTHKEASKIVNIKHSRKSEILVENQKLLIKWTEMLTIF